MTHRARPDAASSAGRLIPQQVKIGALCTSNLRYNDAPKSASCRLRPI